MQLIQRINLMENKKVIFWLNICSILLFILFLPIFSLLLVIQNKPILTSEATNGWGLLFLGGLFFLIIIIHEFIHALFFKIFYPKGKVKFGFKNGMAYAASPNSFYSKRQFFIIGISPFVIITIGLIILLFAKLIPAYFFVLLASIHAACLN